MPVSIEELRPHLQAFDFRRLFVEGLGWDHYAAEPLLVEVGGFIYSLRSVAEKAGFAVFVCDPGPDGDVPPYPVRNKLESHAAKAHYEHLIIFANAARTLQIWLWSKREPGKSPKPIPWKFRAGQPGDSLLQRLQVLAFNLEDEAAGIGVTDVDARVRKAFDVEKVTKRFYERFRKELSDFSAFIDGITAEADRDWYASLMLNRMMFVYFIQKQSFLDGDPDYLRNRLEMVQSLPVDSEITTAPQESASISDPTKPVSQSAPAEPVEVRSGGRFQQFYRLFLLRLFHEGLGQPEAQRAPELAALLGRVPFLNGGLFDVHDLERDNPDIGIPDAAFERVFDFFDGYRWHLDERPYREDNEINPDVLGYIFEKYVNQKQMGAYYTKEDITGYISRNTVIPFLFDAARKECPVAFGPDGGVWRLLRDDPDRYVYPAVGHGIAWNARQPEVPKRLDAPFDLPEHIAAGIDDVSKRGGWNAPAPDDYALPTETWREVVARRTRYEEVKAKLASGEAQEINDLITLNLDIEQFAKDVIAQSERPDLLLAFWHALYGNRKRSDTGISVLDPTCGSGAFLFAALNVLEPLYTACLEGMRGFLDDAARSERKRSPEHLGGFRRILEQVEKHPSERYFILKSIVLNNLYGVDIMEEAVEICKLRLFLKLVAQLESYDQIEPLPDIDFNIRAGNTLVGFTSLDAVRQAMTVTPDGQGRALFDEERAALMRTEEEAETASRAFDRFRQQQTDLGGEITAANKAELRRQLATLGGELNRYLAAQYGVNVNDPTAFNTWQTTHQPFHWFTEFYGIMTKGGFDVVIGNPPYVAYSNARKEYEIKGFLTEQCGNLYGYVLERSATLLGRQSRCGMIVPLSIAFSNRFVKVRRALLDDFSFNWFSSYDNIPASIFEGVSQRCTVWVGATRHKGNETPHVAVTPMKRWRAAYRPVLLPNLVYTMLPMDLVNAAEVPKLSGDVQAELYIRFSKEREIRSESHDTIRGKKHSLGFSQAARNFVSVFLSPPPTLDAKALKPVNPSKVGYLTMPNERAASAAYVMCSGATYFWFWLVRGDGFDVTSWVVSSFVGITDRLPEEYLGVMSDLGRLLHGRRYEALVFKKNAGKYVGNYNYHSLAEITVRADLLTMAALGLGRGHALEVFDYVQRVLSINMLAGEKAIPAAVKAKFAARPFDETRQRKLFAHIDRMLCGYYGFTDEELDAIIDSWQSNRLR